VCGNLLDEARIEKLKGLALSFNHVFRDPGCLNKALTHKSFANENQDLRLRDNERFEFLGDSVIDLIVSRYLLYQNRSMTEGELSKIRAQVVNEQSLAQFARSIDLGEYLLLGKGEEASGGRDKNSLLANAFEAVVAALFLDTSFDETYQMFLNAFKKPIDEITAEKKITDYKGQIQKYCQAHILSNPQYRLVSESGPDHEKIFTVQVFILGEPYGAGMGRTKKEAEQAAARNSYEQLITRHKHHV